MEEGGNNSGEEEYTYWGIGMYEDFEGDLSVKFSNNKLTDIQPHDVVEAIKMSRLATCSDVITFNIIMYGGVYSEGIMFFNDNINASTHWIMFKFKPYELILANSLKTKITYPFISWALNSASEGNPNLSLDLLESQEAMEKEFEQAGIMRRITKEEYEDIKNRYRKHFNVQ